MAFPRSWVAAIAASVVLHMVLLAVLGWHGERGDWTISQLPAWAMKVRLLQAAGAGAANPLLPRPTDPAVRAPLVPASEVPPPAEVQDNGPVADQAGGAPPGLDSAAQDGYLPPEKLTLRPQALSDVVIPPTEDGAQIGGSQAGVFTLFIDTTGAVRRMVIDGPTLTPGLEVLVRQAFMAARFSPGEVAGRPVKSLLRIEVDFGAPPVQPPDIAVQPIPTN
jgi:hypothetical protein